MVSATPALPSALPISFLFVPGDRPERFAKAAASGADAIIIDLEDAVAPDAKASARAALKDGAAQSVPVFVRINARGTPWFTDDLDAVAALPLIGVMLPKTSRADDVAVLREALGAGKEIIALIESAEGIASARAIAAAQGCSRLAFGSIDYCADLGSAHTREALLAARSELVLASRLAGIGPPVDGVTTAIDDAALIAGDARYGLELGFGGKLCIHPKQLAPLHEGFAPNASEIAWAEKILSQAGEGAVAVGGVMVDAPVRANAQRILARRRA